MRNSTLTAVLLAGLLLLRAGSPDADILWDQSNFRTDSSGGASQFLPVNDFQLSQSATITGFSVWLSDASGLFGGDEVADGVFRSFSGGLSWYFFQDAAGLPGLLIDSGFDPAVSVTDTGVNRTSTSMDDIFRVDGVVSPGLQLRRGDVLRLVSGKAWWARTTTTLRSCG